MAEQTTATRPRAVSPVGDVDVAAPGPIARIAAIVAVLAMLVAVAFLPELGSTGSTVEGSATLSLGALEAFDGSEWQPVTTGATVPSDTELRAREDGAVLAVDDGRLELTAGARLVMAAESVSLDRGSILVVSPASWSVTAVGVTSSGSGAWRIDSGIAGRVAVYEGAVDATAENRSLAVPALFEASMIEGDLGAVATPLRYLASDEWDRRFLADAIAIDRAIEQLQVGWRNQYGELPQRVAFYEDFVSGLEGADSIGVADSVELLASRRDGNLFGPPIEVLAGLVMARAHVAATGVLLSDAAAQILGLRRSGATWGLTATLLELDQDAIAEAAEAGLTDRQDAVDQGTAEPVLDDPAPTGPPDSQPPPTGPTPPEPTNPPTEEPNEPPTEEPTTGVVDSLGNIIDDVGGLLEPDSDPDLTGTLGDVIDEVGVILDDTLGGLLGGG